MPSTLELIGETVKNFSQRAVVRRLNFMPSMTSGGGSYGVSTAGDLSLRHAFTSTGGALDYESAAGDVLTNSVVAACVNAIAQALPEAPILLEKRVGGNSFERVDFHPVLDLLHNPNPYLSEAELWGITTSFERTSGEAFWYFEYDSSGKYPREIWFRAPQFVQILSDADRFISGYKITAESGAQVDMDECNVVHFRHQLNPLNPRAGWSPIQTGRRQIVGDNGAAAYHSAILRNAGAASLIISLKDAAAAGEVTPGQLDEYVQLFKKKVSGEGSGAILGMDLPLDIHKVGFSPDELALEKLLEYYESRICALMGVNRRVINLGSDPTYENSKVALNDFWERTIIPMRRRHASTLSSQLLPLFGLDPAQYRLRFDFSEIEALREDMDALHARWRSTFTAGGIDLFTFQEKVGLKPEEEYKGLYSKPSQVLGGNEESGGDEIKARAWDESDHQRASDGRFGSVAGTHAGRGLPTQAVSGSAAGAGGSGAGNSGGAGAVGASTGGKKKQKKSGVEKLHRDHGVSREERRIGHEGGALLNDDHVNGLLRVTSMEQSDITDLMDGAILNMESQGHSVDEARKLLVDFHDDPKYQALKKKVEVLKQSISDDYFDLDDDLKGLSPQQQAALSQKITLDELTLAADELDLQHMHKERYPKMWEALCANDNPKFDKNDFDIEKGLHADQHKEIKTGIDFLARMIGGRQVPAEEDLRFRNLPQGRSAYFAVATGEWEANTIAFSRDANADSVVHEMGHWLASHNPQIGQQLEWHHDRRTEGDPTLNLRNLDKSYMPNEVYKRDQYADAYMGKFYPDLPLDHVQNEVLSRGLSYFVLAPDVLAKRDPQTFNFIYKLLRGQNPEIDPARVPKKHSKESYQREKYERRKHQR